MRRITSVFLAGMAAANLAWINPVGVGPDAGERVVGAASLEWPIADQRSVRLQVALELDTSGTGILDDALLELELLACRRNTCSTLGEPFHAMVDRASVSVREDETRIDVTTTIYGQEVTLSWQTVDGAESRNDSRIQAYDPILPFGQVRVYARESTPAAMTASVQGVECRTESAFVDRYVIYDGVNETTADMPTSPPQALADLFGKVPCDA